MKKLKQPEEFTLKKHENNIHASLTKIDNYSAELIDKIMKSASQVKWHLYYTEGLDCDEQEMTLEKLLEMSLSYMNTDALESGHTAVAVGYIDIPKAIKEDVSHYIEIVNREKQSIKEQITSVKALYKGSAHYIQLFKSTRFHKRINWKMLNRHLHMIEDNITHMTFYHEKNVVSNKLTQEALLKKLNALKKTDLEITKEISCIQHYDASEIFYMRYDREIRHAVNIYTLDDRRPVRIICSTPVFVCSKLPLHYSYNVMSARKKRLDAGEYIGPIIDSLPIYTKS